MLFALKFCRRHAIDSRVRESLGILELIIELHLLAKQSNRCHIYSVVAKLLGVGYPLKGSLRFHSSGFLSQRYILWVEVIFEREIARRLRSCLGLMSNCISEVVSAEG